MKRIFQSGLTAKLVLLLALPVLVLTGLGIQNIRAKDEVRREGRALFELSALGVKLGNLAHELQKERGSTALFLNSKGAKFAAELPAQQTATDAVEQELRNFRQHFDARPFGGDFQKALETADADWETVKARRAAVSSLGIPL